MLFLTNRQSGTLGCERRRARALRSAFEAAIGEGLEQIIRTAYGTPKPVVQMVQKAMGR